MLIFECLSKDIIYQICENLNKKSICELNLTNKNISRKVTYYMVNNLTYKCYATEMMVNEKYKETHLKWIKKVKIYDMKYLELFKNNLINISFVNTFDEPLDSIELSYFSNLKILSFGKFFNQPIEHIYFPNLQQLSFGSCFNKPIERLSTPKLQQLSFGACFDNPIEKLNTPNLQEIFFGDGLVYSIDNLQYTYLKKIYLHFNYKYIENLKIQHLHELCIYHNDLTYENECNDLMNTLIKKYPNWKISMLHNTKNIKNTLMFFTLNQ